LPAEAAGAIVTTPSGGTVALEAGKATFAATSEPGVYRAAAAGREWRFAVNLDPSESRTAPLSPEELEQAGVPFSRAASAPPPETERRTVLEGLEAESRQKLWRWLIAAALAVLLIETVFAGRALRRAGATSGETTS
ncbi:MAG: hypothetical protein ACKOE8_13570, partial [Opitutaceae bacterium]